MSSLDAAEFILKRAMIAGVVLLVLAIGLAMWLGNGQGAGSGAGSGRAPTGGRGGRGGGGGGGGGAGTTNPASSPALASPASAAQPQASTSHSLTIQLSRECSVRYANLPHTPQMTVLDLLLSAQARQSAGSSRLPPPSLESGPPLQFVSTGTGPTALISSIMGLANEGGGKASRNWQFWVNSQMGQTGAGSAILNPGDRVVWAFTLWDDTQRPPEP